MGGFALSPEDRERIESDPELFYYRFLLQRHFPPLYMNALINPPAQGISHLYPISSQPTLTPQRRPTTHPNLPYRPRKHKLRPNHVATRPTSRHSVKLAARTRQRAALDAPLLSQLPPPHRGRDVGCVFGKVGGRGVDCRVQGAD